MAPVIRFVAVWTLLFLCSPETRSYEQAENISNDVEDLTFETDFRSMTLQWRHVASTEPPGFVISLCEISIWLSSKINCRERHLLTGKRGRMTGHDSLITDDRGHYQAVLNDLRMLTNYTVSVEPMSPKALPPPKRKPGERARLFSPEKILVTTKGFSAQATNCVTNSSDIVVHTGPYFGGKIAVEDAEDARCAIYGNRTSPQDTYTLRIDHHLCGSKTVNDSRIDTIVVVHESSTVVTHNSRRFLVQCSFLPETFTIKAAFNVPEEMQKKNNFDYKKLEQVINDLDNNDVFTYDQYKQNHVKDSRILAEHGSVLQKNVGGYESQMLGLLIVIIVLVIVVVLVIGLGLWWYISGNRRRSSSDIETVSTSGSSFLTFTADKDALMNQNALQNDVNSLPKNMTPFYGAQVALVSLKPVKEIY